jgi:8-oxo-dGTP pyrophosphatase MutT (NUDIX family)
MLPAMPAPDDVTHAGAVPVVRTENGLRIVLITSSSGRKWIVPKGVIEGGDTRRTAMMEAWEEAGVRGGLAPEPLGTYTHPHSSRPDNQVVTYLLVVDEILHHWPEDRWRRRLVLDETAALRMVWKPLMPMVARALEWARLDESNRD